MGPRAGLDRCRKSRPPPGFDPRTVQPVASRYRGQRHTPAALYPWERPGTHCTGGWMGPRAGLDRCRKSRPPPGFDPRTVQPVASRYTGSASRPGRSLPLGKTRYPLYRRLDGPQGRSGQVQKILPPTGIRSPDRPARSQSLYRVSVTPRPLFTPGKDPVPIVQEAGWAPGPVWTGAENLAPHRDSIPGPSSP